MHHLIRPRGGLVRGRGRAGVCAHLPCRGGDARDQSRRATRLAGCFVPRHLNSPRLAPSSLSSSSSSSSPSRSCPFVLVLLFGRGGESESDDDVFESTLLRATEAGA